MSNDDMELIISENLKQLLRDYKLNQNELAKIAGVSESTVGKWILRKAIPRMGAIQKIADHFNLPKSYILKDLPTNVTPAAPLTVPVPIIGTIACGEPLLAEDNIIGYIYESPDQLPKGNVFYVEAKGTSMEPTIPSGSRVMIREQPEVENGEIAAVLLNGDTEATLKRVKRQGEIIILLPDNTEHEPIVVTSDNPARILGKALRFTQEL